MNTEWKNKIRVPALNYLKDVRNIPFPCVGRNETQVLNNIEKEKGIKLTRQYQVLGYYVDGYDKENNICYEVDESFHKNQKEKDLIRQNEIERHLDCQFIRLKC